MKLTVIGYESGCPTLDGGTSCYLIEDKDIKIVLDMGAGSLRDLQKYVDIFDLDAVIISHFHADHFSDIFAYQQAISIQKQLKEANPEAVKDIKEVTIYAPFNEDYTHLLKQSEKMAHALIDKESQLKIGHLDVSFIETVHGLYGLSIKIDNGEESMCYTSDTQLHDKLIDFAKESQLLLTECTLYERAEIIKGHMAASDVKEFIGKTKAKNVVLIHTPTYGNKEDLIKNIDCNGKTNVMLGKTGLEILV